MAKVRFSCPRCGRSFESSEIGAKFECSCGTRVEIPAPPPSKTVLGVIEPQPVLPRVTLPQAVPVHGVRAASPFPPVNAPSNNLQTAGASRRGLLIAVGIIAIVYGSFALLWGIMNFVPSAWLFDFRFLVELPGFTFVSTAYFVNGILEIGVAGTGISGGIGLLNRQKWGRNLVAITAAVALLILVLDFISLKLILGWGLPIGKGWLIGGVTLRVFSTALITIFANMLFRGSRTGDYC